jgi:hypothetical protein
MEEAVRPDKTKEAETTNETKQSSPFGCFACGKREVGNVILKWCEGCQCVKYCSSECQQQDKEVHKTVCVNTGLNVGIANETIRDLTMKFVHAHFESLVTEYSFWLFQNKNADVNKRAVLEVFVFNNSKSLILCKMTDIEDYVAVNPKIRKNEKEMLLKTKRNEMIPIHYVHFSSGGFCGGFTILGLGQDLLAKVTSVVGTDLVLKTQHTEFHLLYSEPSNSISRGLLDLCTLKIEEAMETEAKRVLPSSPSS